MITENKNSLSVKSASLLICLLSFFFISAETLADDDDDDAPPPSDSFVTINGIAKQGQVLTADVSSIRYSYYRVAFSYQWLRSGVDIGKATASTYTLVQADVGSKIRVRVRVSYVYGGRTIETLVSEQTAIVASTNDAPEGLPVISGSLTQDSVLTAETSGISDADGLGAFSYQWLRNGKAIRRATSNTYTLVQKDVGRTIMVTVSYTDASGAVESVTSVATAVITNPNDLPTGAVTISGSLTQGSLLTAEASAITDADGLGAFHYQWLRNGVAISKATAGTYLLVQADVANKISVRVSYTDGGGLLESVTSAPTTAVSNLNDAPAGLPVISGKMTQGRLLKADTSGITDADGLGVFSYQWLRDGRQISGALASSYTLEQADVNAFISLMVSYTDAGLTDESVLSHRLGPVQNINDPGVVTIAGQATEGSSLEVDVIADADGTGLSNFIYQWLRDGADIVDESGVAANTDSYVLTSADVGRKITLRLDYTDDLGTNERVTSNAIGPVFADLPSVTAPVLNPVNATGWFTFVDIGQAVAFDALDGPLTVTSDSNGQFRPGETVVTWSATDLAGNMGTATQIVKVVPLVEVSKNQRSAEGDRVEFKVILNGDALDYPVKVPYFVSGTADGNDHTLVRGNVWIEKPAAGELPAKSVNFTIKMDADNAEGSETIVVTLNIPENAVLGPVTTHTVEIVEGNVAPLVSLSAYQFGSGYMLQVDPEGGEVTVVAIATDANNADDLVYNWSSTDNALIDDDGDSENSRFILNLQTTPVTPGFYRFHVAVSDGTETIASELMISVLSVAPELGTLDSDNDGINDETEGFGDADADGVADYLDAIGASNVLQQKITLSDQFLIQTEPGLKLSLGETAFKAGQGRSMVAQTEVTDYSFGGNTPVDEIANTGGYFDFTVYGLPIAGQTVLVVIPQQAPMPRSSVYRKLTVTGWQDFVQNNRNSIASAAGEEGYCPPPGDAAYQPGLHEGYWCLQLNIEDGGPNDIDGIANNTVTDPGGVGQVLTDVNVSSSGGGGAFNPLLPALSIFTLLTLRNKNRKRVEKKQYENSFGGFAGWFVNLPFSSSR